MPGWEGWGVGQVEERSGFFPLNYVERISDREHLAPGEKNLKLAGVTEDAVAEQGEEGEESATSGDICTW